MRRALLLPVLLAIVIAAGVVATATAQQRDQAIEQSPLAPIAPRLPGGTVVGPDAATEDPATGDASAIGGAPAETGPDDGRPEAGTAPATTDPDAAAADDAGATEGIPSGWQEPAPHRDLFKRAPPGTGSLAPMAPAAIVPVARKPVAGAELRELDKLTGRIETFELATGEETQVERLRIALDECHVPVDGTSSNHIAYLRIWDVRATEAAPVFDGWMFADSPSLSAMDHKRYDLWVIRCITADGSESAAKR